MRSLVQNNVICQVKFRSVQLHELQLYLIALKVKALYVIFLLVLTLFQANSCLYPGILRSVHWCLGNLTKCCIWKLKYIGTMQFRALCTFEVTSVKTMHARWKVQFIQRTLKVYFTGSHSLKESYFHNMINMFPSMIFTLFHAMVFLYLNYLCMYMTYVALLRVSAPYHMMYFIFVVVIFELN